MNNKIKKQFIDDIISALYEYEKATGAKKLKENRIDKIPVEIQTSILKHPVDDWKSLFDEDVYNEVCSARYQLCDSLSKDDSMFFHDLHTLEMEKDGRIEITMYSSSKRGDAPICSTISIVPGQK